MTFEPIAIDWPAGIAPHHGCLPQVRSAIKKRTSAIKKANEVPREIVSRPGAICAFFRSVKLRWLGPPPSYFANLLLFSGNYCLRDRVAVVPPYSYCLKN